MSIDGRYSNEGTSLMDLVQALRESQDAGFLTAAEARFILTRNFPELRDFDAAKKALDA